MAVMTEREESFHPAYKYVPVSVCYDDIITAISDERRSLTWRHSRQESKFMQRNSLQQCHVEENGPFRRTVGLLKCQHEDTLFFLTLVALCQAQSSPEA